MLFAKLIVIQPGRPTRELEILDDQVSIGRAPDNTVSLEGDTNVSRYHAEIEKRGSDFYLIDLGSSNGTTVNNELVEREHSLQNEDLISVGGSTLIEFHLSDTPWPARVQHPRQTNNSYSSVRPDPSPVKTPSSPVTTPPSPVAHTVTPDFTAAAPQVGGVGKPAGMGRGTFIAIGIGGGLLITGLAAVLIYSTVSSRCNPTARIVNPQSGTTISGSMTIRVETADEKCIDRLIYQLDGRKLASAEVAPYSISLEPEKISGLEAGNHILSVTVEDHDGNKNLQPETVLLAFETGARGPAPEGEKAPPAGNANQPSSPGTATSSISISEVKEMAGQLARRINAKGDYIFDPEFLQQVQSRTRQYARAATLDRAPAYRDVINEAFVGEQGLPASLGYVMAMSRSGFALQSGQNAPARSAVGAADEPQGLWRIQPSLVPLARCGPVATLTDQDQKCSAMVTSVYMRALMVDIFNGDFVYVIATFSLPRGEASRFRDQLPPDRRDFWKMLKSAPQRERVVNFFAAGIVGENPQKFNLASDKSLVNLY